MVLGCEIGAERILEHPDIERLKTENKKLSEKRKKLEADLKKSRAEVQKLRNSKSWKVTAPLRAVMRLFGKGLMVIRLSALCVPNTTER